MDRVLNKIRKRLSLFDRFGWRRVPMGQNLARFSVVIQKVIFVRSKRLRTLRST